MLILPLLMDFQVMSYFVCLQIVPQWKPFDSCLVKYISKVTFVEVGLLIRGGVHFLFWDIALHRDCSSLFSNQKRSPYPEQVLPNILIFANSVGETVCGLICIYLSMNEGWTSFIYLRATGVSISVNRCLPLPPFFC